MSPFAVIVTVCLLLVAGLQIATLIGFALALAWGAIVAAFVASIRHPVRAGFVLVAAVAAVIFY